MKIVVVDLLMLKTLIVVSPVDFEKGKTALDGGNNVSWSPGLYQYYQETLMEYQVEELSSKNFPFLQVVFKPAIILLILLEIMKKLFIWVSFTAIICVTAWFAFDYWTIIKIEKECQGWPQINCNLREFPQIYPATESGQTIKEIQTLYEKISSSDSQVDHDLRQLLRDYLDREFANPVAAIGAIPPEIKNILLANHEGIEQITKLLLTEDILVLPLNVDISPVEPIPANYPWFRGISSLLTVSAFSSQLSGDMYKAWLFLEASARLSEALFLQPSLVSQMVAFVESRSILFAMRKMTVPAPEWALGWPKHDLVEGMLMAYTAEAYIMLNMVAKTSLSELQACTNDFHEDLGLEPVGIGIATKVIYALTGQSLLRFYAAGQIASARDAIQQRSREGLCVSQPSQIDNVGDDVGFWYPGKTLLPTFVSTSAVRHSKYWDRIVLLKIYKAGTRAILETKMVKVGSAAKGWPRVPPALADSCLAHLWSYQHKADGSVVFSYTKPLPESMTGGRVQPGYLKYIGKAAE